MAAPREITPDYLQGSKNTLPLKGQFYTWLYMPHNNISIEEVFSQAKSYGVPTNVILRKIIEWRRNCGETDIQVLQYINNKGILTGVPIGIIQRVIESTPKYTTKIMSEQVALGITNIIETAKEVKQAKEEADHTGYPLVDPEKGRPYINWQVCTHKGCFQKFNTPHDIIKHLKDYHQYKMGFHKSHEDAINQQHLTIESIIKNNITTCPSIICDTGKFDNPPDLINHLKLLGISPFWQQGMVFAKEEDNNILEFHEHIYNKMISSEYCLVCQDEKPQVMNIPCYHHNLCFSCYNKVRTCPICRISIMKQLPF